MTAAAPVALVTGGARRIGRAIAEDLARHGWAVAIHFSQSHEDAHRVAAGITAGGGSAACVQGDLADPSSPEKIVAAAVAALGPLTLLVNNAAIFEKDSAGQLDSALWQRQMTVNLMAPVFMADAFARQLPAGVEGNIVNMLDQRIWRPTPSHFSYQISKSALHAATEALAQALAPRIRVNGIAPGPALPNVHARDDKAFQRLVATLPLGRGPDLADFGRTVRYFVESRSITGQVIALDGGEHIEWRQPEKPVSPR
jgi:NAD(P)-dependent dehydrogenase (short-subunit alcohol dehydrogenase family)